MGFIDELRHVLTLSDNIKTLAVQSLVSEACFGMFYVVWQPYIIELKATIPQLGLVQGVMTLFAAVGSLFWGRLSDRVGRKPVYSAAFVCRFIALLFCFTARSWISFLGFGVFMGLSATWMQSHPAGTALMTESVDEARVGTAISVYMSLGMMASIVTAPLGGYIALNRGYQLIFLSCLAGELFNIAFISLRLRETLASEFRSFRGGASGLRRNLADFIRPESSLIPFYVVSILSSFSYRLSLSMLYGLLVESYGFNTVQLGLMSTIFGVSWGLSQIPLGWLMDRHGKKRFLLMSQAVSMLAIVGYVTSKSFIVFAAMEGLSGLGHAMWIPAYLTMVAERVPSERRSSTLGKLTTLTQLFGIPAPYIGGVIYQILGFSAPMLIRLAVLVLCSSIVFAFIDEGSVSLLRYTDFRTLRTSSPHLLVSPFCSRFVCILPDGKLSNTHHPSSFCFWRRISRGASILSSPACPSLVTTKNPLRMSQKNWGKPGLSHELLMTLNLQWSVLNILCIRRNSACEAAK